MGRISRRINPAAGFTRRSPKSSPPSVSNGIGAREPRRVKGGRRGMRTAAGSEQVPGRSPERSTKRFARHCQKLTRPLNWNSRPLRTPPDGDARDRQQPLLAVRVVQPQDRAGIEHVVHVEVGLQPPVSRRANTLLSRRSSCVRRSSNMVFGAIRGTVAVAVHTAWLPHAARLRPSDGAITALVAGSSPGIAGPATF